MSQILRVLCVFSCLDPGGSETMCMNLYRKIDRSKIQFDFVKHTHSIGTYEKEILSLGGRVFKAPKLSLSNYFQYTKWWRTHLNEHPEHTIIHVHFFTITTAIVTIAHKYNRIVIGHSHGYAKRKGVNPFLRKAYLRIGSAKVDYALACSYEAGEYMYGKKDFHILNNAIDTQRFQYNIDVREKIRCEFSLRDEIVLGHIGRFVPVKNHRFILDIFNAIRKKRYESKLMLVGDGSLRADTEDYARELGIIDEVIFTGVRTDVNELLQAMDCFLFPSLYEGLGVVLIEAQTSGLPCVASDTIPDEAILTNDLVLKISLENTADEWAERIISILNKKRYSRVDDVKAHGYDINDAVKWLEDFYFSINSNNSE